jgi:hypothetical protein
MVDLGTIANVATAIAVVTGLVFGIIEVSRSAAERRERAELEMLHSLLSADWIHSVEVVHRLPDDAELATPEQRAAGDSLAITLEMLGYAVFRRIVPLESADALVGGAARVAWRKLRSYCEKTRRASGSDKMYEWFQWLAEQLERRHGKLTEIRGAHVVHRGWRP